VRLQPLLVHQGFAQLAIIVREMHLLLFSLLHQMEHSQKKDSMLLNYVLEALISLSEVNPLALFVLQDSIAQE
jgi:hypothetical protein